MADSYLRLAYKRIGLLFFLIMVMAGLVTVFLKIYYTKTSYYLLRINVWVAVLLLVFASFFDFDEVIAKYNLARKSSIPVDVPFLLSLSDKTLPLIEENKNVLETDKSYNFLHEGISFNSAADLFEFRKKEFLERQQHYTWLSWNFSDQHIKQSLFPLYPVLSSQQIQRLKFCHEINFSY